MALADILYKKYTLIKPAATTKKNRVEFFMIACLQKNSLRFRIYWLILADYDILFWWLKQYRKERHFCNSGMETVPQLFF